MASNAITALPGALADLDADATLEHLLEVWRDTPHPALAACIETAAARTSPASLRAKRVRDTAANLLSACRKRVRRAADLTAILEVFPAGGIDAGGEQMARLAKWPRDPRLADHLLSLVEDPPYRSRKALPFWQRAFETVRTIGDPRSAERCTDLISRTAECFARPMSELIRDELLELRAALPSRPPAIGAEALATLDELRVRLAPGAVDRSSVDELLAEVHADPDNDELRLVLADALGATGDPRGELIMLQHQKETGRLTRDQSARLKSLLAEHTGDWLGDFEPILLSSSISFRLGMLDAATLKAKNVAHVRPLIGDPRWSTVRDLEVKIPAEYHDEAANAARGAIEEVLRSPVMRGLRRLDGNLHPTFIVELCTSKTPRPIEALGVVNTWPAYADEVMRALHEAPGLPALRELSYRVHGRQDVESYEWLRRSPLFTRLERLEVACELDALPGWLEALAGGGPARLALRDYWGHNVIESDGVSLSGRFRYPGGRSGLGGLTTALAALPAKRFKTIKIAAARSYTPGDDELAALRAALEHAADAHKLPKSLSG